jgi:acetyl-CoA synthetase
MPVSHVTNYNTLYSQFRWQIPVRYNIGVDICDRWAHAEPDRLAILHVRPDRRTDQISFGALRATSNRLANLLRARGVARGDRVAIFMPQAPEVAAAHIAIYKLGAVALPIAVLFGPDALVYRLQNSGAKALLTNAQGLAKLEEIRAQVPEVACVISVGGEGFADVLAKASSDFTPVDTSAEDPAMMIYTSGTTGQPKGALHAHRVLLGHLPGAELPHYPFPQKGDCYWTPADWAWAGGLLDVLLPSLYHGVPVVASKVQKFDPEEAFALIASAGVRNALVLGSCAQLGVLKAGAIGKPVSGHTVAVIDGEGYPVKSGEIGQIAVKRPDPVMFLEYWSQPEATRDKFIGDWMTTGDQGVMDDDGYISFIGRDDDVITSSGFRIGPGEIEDCLIRHTAVALAAAVGKPDPIRNEIVKAFIVLKDGYAPSDKLAGEIQDFVRTRLSAHEYPREVAFIAQMPMTTTGKVIRRLLREQA